MKKRFSQIKKPDIEAFIMEIFHPNQIVDIEFDKKEKCFCVRAIVKLPATHNPDWIIEDTIYLYPDGSMFAAFPAEPESLNPSFRQFLFAHECGNDYELLVSNNKYKNKAKKCSNSQTNSTKPWKHISLAPNVP